MKNLYMRPFGKENCSNFSFIQSFAMSLSASIKLTILPNKSGNIWKNFSDNPKVAKSVLSAKNKTKQVYFLIK